MNRRSRWRLLAIASLAALASPLAAQVLTPDITASASRPPAGLGVTVFGATSIGQDSGPSVLIGVEVQGLSDSARTPAAPRQVEVVYRIDVESTAAPTTTSTLTLSDRDELRRAARDGIRVLIRQPMAIGPHVVRVTVRDTADDRTASVAHEFEVPNLLDGSLTMSNLLISGSSAGGVTRPELDDDRLMPLTGRPPSGQREFSRSEKVEVNAEIYEAPADDGFGSQLRITTAILAPDGHVVFEATDVGSSETLPSGILGYQHYALVPIGTLEPGPYVVRVLAATDGGIVTWRAVPISVK